MTGITFSQVGVHKIAALLIVGQLLSGCGKSSGGNPLPPPTSPTAQQAAASPTPSPTATATPAKGPSAPIATSGNKLPESAPPSGTGGVTVPSPVVTSPPTVVIAPGGGTTSSGDLCKLHYTGKFRDHGDAATLSIHIPNDASPSALFKLNGEGHHYTGEGTCEMVSQTEAQFHFTLSTNHNYVFQGEIAAHDDGKVVLVGVELKSGKVFDHIQMSVSLSQVAKGKKPVKAILPGVPTLSRPAQVPTLELCKMSYRGTFTNKGDAAVLKVDENKFILTGNRDNYSAEGACTQTSATAAVFRFTLDDNKNYVFKGSITAEADGSAQLSGSELKAGKVIDHLSLSED